MKLWRAALIAALLVSAAACQILAGIGDDNFTVAPRDASPDVDVDVAEVGPPDLCPHAVPGQAPERSDSDDERAFLFAVRSVDLTGRGDAGDPVGFDLDGVCACDPRDPRGTVPSCVAPAGATNACDFDGGIDNAAVSLFDAVKGFVPANSDPQADYNHQLDCGQLSILLLITKYNGQANDTEVIVGVVESSGIRAPHDAGEPPDDAGCFVDGGLAETYLPRHDGTDLWSVPSATVRTTSAGLQAANAITGSVKNFQLVFDGRKLESRIPVVFATTVVSISTPVLSVKLVPVDQNGKDIPVDGAGRIQSADGKAASFRLANGVLTGRAPVDDALAAAGATPIGGKFLCESALEYGIVKSVVCGAADTAAIPPRDFKADSPCDAISVVFQFNAVAAGLDSTPHDPPGRDSGCPRDTCNAGH